MRFLWLFLVLVTVSACDKNEGCTEFGSENYDPDAVINDGSCILTRDKFLGTFRVDSDCIIDQYNRTISATQDDYVVVISSLADTLGDVEARVFGENITIDMQTIQSNITIEGAGVYVADSSISMTYRIRDFRSGTEVIHDCFELCVKQ